MSNSELSEIKKNYIALSKHLDVSKYTMLEIADKYINETDEFKKDVYAAVLILHCWPALEKLYYKQQVKVLSQNDCYDIFMDSFLYVIEKQVWKNESNKLYNDKDAILKAMHVVVESRRKNYFVAQNRQKRYVNQCPVSLDVLSEDFQDGYFSSITETYNFDRGWDKLFVKNLWLSKRYISAIIFDILMNLNVFDVDEVDYKKIKKHVKHISKEQYKKFLKRYDIIDNDLIIYNKYIKNIEENMIYTHIINSFNSFKSDLNLKHVKENNDYQSYNVILAQSLGLNAAVYLNALIEINEKAIRKNKLDNEHFLIDRNYIKERTTLGISQQKEIEVSLEKASIIHKNGDDYIKVNIDILSSIMMGEKESIVKTLSFLKPQTKTSKKDAILRAVKKNIKESYPEDMKQAYCEWLDVIQNKFGFVSKQMIILAQKTIDSASNHDVDKAIDIIHIASANGWKDMSYAVSVYNKRMNNNFKEVKQNNISISNEQF